MIEPFRHNSWATLRLLDFCQGLDPAVLSTSAPGTYGTIKATLAHLVGAEESYLATAAGAPGPAGRLPFTSLDDLRVRAQRLSDQWERCLDPEPHPERLVERERRLVRIGTVLAQVVNHGNEHRAQVCTVLGTIDIEPPAIDGWAYGNWVMEQRQQR